MADDADELEREVVYRQFDPNDCTPETDVVSAVADLEDKDPTALTPLYPTIDDVISNIFAEPPAPESQVEITFTYEGYRITIHQDGKAEFVKVA